MSEGVRESGCEREGVSEVELNLSEVGGSWVRSVGWCSVNLVRSGVA